MSGMQACGEDLKWESCVPGLDPVECSSPGSYDYQSCGEFDEWLMYRTCENNCEWSEWSDCAPP